MSEDTTLAKPRKNLHYKMSLSIFASLLFGLGLYAGWIYQVSPSVIRKPRLEHYHFRMQILVNGQAQNFAEDKYQQTYFKDQCSAILPEQPIHFHDKKDQIVHIHWESMTGGMVLKYYGWNFIGGINNALGYRFDDLKNIQKVSTHGNVLPTLPENTSFYIYIGDEKSHQAKSFDDWKNQDLEQFFGTTSNFPGHAINKGKTSLLDKILPKAHAHGTADDVDGNDGNETEQEKLTRINNLIGNVVIFVQKDKPTDQQIQDRFNALEPLSASTCGG